MEAERLGVDPADLGEAELHCQVYEVWSRQSGRRGSPCPILDKTYSERRP
jgi:hypothetical protein